MNTKNKNEFTPLLKDLRRLQSRNRQAEGDALRKGVTILCDEQGWSDHSLVCIYEQFIFEKGLTLELLEFMRKCQKQENGDDSKEDGIDPES
jgi:hypothetical protein